MQKNAVKCHNLEKNKHFFDKKCSFWGKMSKLKKKTIRFTMDLTPEQHELFKLSAKNKKRTMKKFIISAVIENLETKEMYIDSGDWVDFLNLY